MDPIIQKLKALKPDEPEEEIARDVDGIRRAKPGITDDEILQHAQALVQGGGQPGAPTPAAPAAPAAPARPPMGAMMPDEPEGLTGRDAAMAALQGLAGFGDAMARRAGQNTNYLGGAMKADQDAQAARSGRRKELADHLTRQKAEGRADAGEARAAATFDRTQAEQKEKDDPASPISKTYQELAARMIPGKDYSQMSASQLERALPPIVKMYEIETEAKRRTEDATTKATEKADKAALEAKGKVIPGFEADGTVNIDEPEAKKLRDGVAEFRTFKQSLQEYRDLIKKHGTTEILDRGVAAEMDALAKGLQLKVKNLGQLGVLSAADIPFIEKQIPEPGILKTGAAMLGALKATEEAMNKGVTNTMSVRGYRPTAEFQTFINGPAEAPGGAAPAGALPPDKQKRLEELRRKRDQGTLK